MHKYLKKRSQKLRDTLKSNQINNLLLTKPASITYLTGIYPINTYEREAFVLLTPSQVYLFLTPLKKVNEHHLKHIKTTILGNGIRLTDLLEKLVHKDELYVEADNMTMAEYHRLTDKLDSPIKPLPHDFLAKQREVKDQFEIEAISRACQITRKTWNRVKKELKPGVSEITLAQYLIQTQIEYGADGIPFGFDPIVAFGPHTAVPHHSVTHEKLKLNQPILVDFGCTVAGYTSDFTRTMWFGDFPSDQFTQIEKLVKGAYKQAIMELKKSGLPHRVDEQTFNYLAAAGYEELVVHTTGHGVGLEIHETPTLYRRVESPQMKPGTVITIEPGLYFAESFGYRYENTILISPNGIETLT